MPRFRLLSPLAALAVGIAILAYAPEGHAEAPGSAAPAVQAAPAGQTAPPAKATPPKPKLSELRAAERARARTEPAARAKALAAARAKAIADAKANEPDWSKEYSGHESGDIETPLIRRRYVRAEWRSNLLPDGKLLTEWEVQITNAGEAVRWGIYRRYHPNGRLAVLGAYRENRPVGVWVWMDEAGQVMRRAHQLAEYEDDLASAPISNPRSQFKNPAGAVVAEGLLKHDKPHGLWMYYYDNGAPKAQGRYLSGLPDGLWSYFYPDGQVQRQSTFALGVPAGLFRTAYADGQDLERGEYDAGVRTGVWRTFFPNGQKREEGYFREDRRDGEWLTWDDTGRLVTRTLYAQGVVTREIAAPRHEPRQPLVSDAEAVNPPRVFDSGGRPIRPEDAWDDPAKASDADGKPVSRTLPRRRAPPPPLSRWTSPTGGESKPTLP
jgi:antitoxin component YwqK of YwqJK toxin-antitoxin module